MTQWLQAHGLDVAEASALISALVTIGATVLKMVTKHWSAYGGPIMRFLVWLLERVSFVSSDGRLSMPGTERKGQIQPYSDSESGSASLILAIAIAGLALFAILVGGSGCGSTQYKVISAGTALTGSLATVVDDMCEPVREACVQSAKCPALGRCLEIRVSAVKELRSLNQALTMATAAATADDSVAAERWTATAKELLRGVQALLKEWVYR